MLYAHHLNICDSSVNLHAILRFQTPKARQIKSVIFVIASIAKQSRVVPRNTGLLRRFASRNDDIY
jgi:hypothetical protein